jgi:hypothetical protein
MILCLKRSCQQGLRHAHSVSENVENSQALDLNPEQQKKKHSTRVPAYSDTNTPTLRKPQAQRQAPAPCLQRRQTRKHNNAFAQQAALSKISRRQPPTVTAVAFQLAAQ